MERFETTQWSVVLAAQAGDSPGAHEALDRLCRDYWRPLFVFLRRAGHSPPDAEDLTQQFLAGLLARDGLARVHPRHGRFRAFLMASLRNFLSHERERAGALKRGGGLRLAALDTEQSPAHGWLESAAEESPEAAFDRQWGLTVLARARRRLEAEYVAAGKTAQFTLLVEYLPGGEPGRSQSEVAAVLDTTVSAVKSEVYRLRQRYGQYLRAEIADTVADPAEIDGEIRYLLGLFAARPTVNSAT
jgi:RNA polymerase sigma-70 factor (ECF subfamily)